MKVCRSFSIKVIRYRQCRVSNEKDINLKLIDSFLYGETRFAKICFRKSSAFSDSVVSKFTSIKNVDLDLAASDIEKTFLSVNKHIEGMELSKKSLSKRLKCSVTDIQISFNQLPKFYSYVSFLSSLEVQNI